MGHFAECKKTSRTSLESTTEDLHVAGQWLKRCVWDAHRIGAASKLGFNHNIYDLIQHGATLAKPDQIGPFKKKKKKNSCSYNWPDTL